MILTVLVLVMVKLPIPDGGWVLDDLEIYHPLSSGFVAVMPDGGIMLLNVTEARVHRFDAEGRAHGTYGRHGQGPGEFAYPISLYRIGDRVYVGDTATTHVFDLEGGFLESVTGRHHLEKLRKVARGWIVHERQWVSENQGLLEHILSWTDDLRETRQVILRFTKAEDLARAPDGRLISRFNPRPEKFLSAYTSTGTHAFFRTPGSSSVIPVVLVRNGPYLPACDVGGSPTTQTNRAGSQRSSGTF